MAGLEGESFFIKDFGLKNYFKPIITWSSKPVKTIKAFITWMNAIFYIKPNFKRC